jgi:methionyl-tRNA synthetase
MKKPTITIDDAVKLDLRAGKVLECVEVPKSDKLLQQTVDLGPDYGVVTILSGIKQYYSAEYMKGKTFVYVANLAARKMMGTESCGMILAADGIKKPKLFRLTGVKPGSEVH